MIFLALRAPRLLLRLLFHDVMTLYLGPAGVQGAREPMGRRRQCNLLLLLLGLSGQGVQTIVWRFNFVEGYISFLCKMRGNRTH
jgi:hypothetical protein